MVDMRTMSELLEAPTEGYRDAIVIPAILAEDFELKVGLLQLVTSSQFHGFERDDTHAHIRRFNKITSMLKYKNVPHDAIKLMLFSFSLDGASRTWLEKEPPRSIHIWEDLVSKFVNYFFLPSKTTNLKNDITNFQQRFDETFTVGGNLLNYTPRDALTVIEDNSRELVLMNKANQQASVKAIEETCVIYGGPHPYYECLAAGGNTFDACAAVGTNNQGGDENPIRTLGDYFKPSHEGYRNTIELLEGNNTVPLRFDIIWTTKLRNDIIMFQQHQGESLSEAWTRFKDLLQKVPHHGIDLWLKVQIFYNHGNPVTRQTINQSVSGNFMTETPKNPGHS
nr:reverse transcriptase domain-containing protein [Tanacetum cinerariifolium]